MRLPRPRRPRLRSRRAGEQLPLEEPSRRRPRRFVRVLDLIEDVRFAVMRAWRRAWARLLSLLRVPLRPFAFALSAIRGGWHRLSDAWFERSLSFRRRSVLVLFVLALYGLVHFAVLPGVPCEISTDECPPSDDAIALVPEDAYTYFHASLEPGSSQYETAKDLLALLPPPGGQPLADVVGNGVLQSAGIRGVTLSGVAGWVGDEAAFASLPSARGRPQSLFLAAVGDEAGEHRFATAIGGGGPRQTSYRGVDLSSYPDGLVTARLGGLVALGGREAVQSAVDVQKGARKGLDESSAASDARAELPAERLADAYVSPAGIARLLAGRGGFAGQLDTFTDFGASSGIAAGLVAHDDGFEFEIDSLLDSGRAKARPPFFAAFDGFSPSLASDLSPSTLAYLGVADPSATVRLLLAQADAAAPGISDAFNAFNRSLRSKGGVDVARDVLPLLDGESAIAITPGRLTPAITAIFAGVDEDKAREAAARLQAPIIESLSPVKTGQAPDFKTRRVGDVTVQSVKLSPTLELSYAVWDGKLVVSTSFAGARAAVSGGADLAGQPGYRSATSQTGSDTSALLFLNLEALVRLAEPNGLSSIAPYATFKADIARLRSLGLSVASAEDKLKTTVFLTIR